MQRPDEVRSLDLVLTARCNLKCSYCYQNDKNSGRMSRETLLASLDFLLRSDADELDLTFYGGEPLLEFPLIRDAVDHVERRRGERPVRYSMSTNGMLLDDDVLSFLTRHRFTTQLSFDGVPSAQRLRGAHTFEQLDALLDHMRRRHPSLFDELLRVAVTVTGATVPHLAESVRYLLGKQVREIQLSPVFTHDPTWKLETIDELNEQFERIRRASVEHYRRVGTVPVTAFRKASDAPRPRVKRPTMCGIGRGDALSVDVDGTLLGCVTLAPSYQTFAGPFLRERVASLSIGDVRDEALPERLAAFPEAVWAAGIFSGKREKYSSYGRCAECEYLADCSVCPTSIGHIPGNRDVNRVPDASCAFQLVSNRHRALFPAQQDPFDLRRVGALEPLLVKELMQEVGS